jgi:hypothetical protein
VKSLALAEPAVLITFALGGRAFLKKSKPRLARLCQDDFYQALLRPVIASRILVLVFMCSERSLAASIADSNR